MASIIKASINLNEIPKDKIIIGKKGKYLPISITINDEQDQFDQDGPIIVQQSKEERESKEAKTFLGNVNVVWSNGQNVEAKIKANGAGPQTKAEEPEDDLPF